MISMNDGLTTLRNVHDKEVCILTIIPSPASIVGEVLNQLGPMVIFTHSAY